MEPAEYSRKLEEFDRLMDDAEPPAAPEALWQLLAELSRHDLSRDGGPGRN